MTPWPIFIMLSVMNSLASKKEPQKGDMKEFRKYMESLKEKAPVKEPSQIT